MSNHALVYHVHTYVPLHNSLQFLIRGQTHTGPRGTSSLRHYHLEQPSEGMSNHSHPPQTPCLQRGATGTRHTQRIHHRQQGEGQYLIPVYNVNTGYRQLIELMNCNVGGGVQLGCMFEHTQTQLLQCLMWYQVFVYLCGLSCS